MDEEEDEVTGRMGRFSRRFSRRFADLGGQKSDMDWLSEADGSEGQTTTVEGKGKMK